MSQSHQQTDSQALLQSMLQKLKLQPGSEGSRQTFAVDAPTPVQHHEKGPFSPQGVNTSPVEVFGFNGSALKEFGSSAEFGFSGGKGKQPGPGCEVSSPVSFPSFNFSAVGNKSKSWVLEHANHPGVTPAGSQHLFPATSPKDIDLTSFKSTNGDTSTFGNFTMTQPFLPNKDTAFNLRSNETTVQGFTPKSYVWSKKSTDTDKDNKELHTGSDAGLDQSKDLQFVSSNQKPTGSRRKQRSSENNTKKRWTQKIKERLKDKHGNNGKKPRGEEVTTDKIIEQEAQVEEDVFNPSKTDGERALSSGSGVSIKTEDSTNDSISRFTSDFEIGLGSFSLLEEITKGQEWAKFINPSHSTPSVLQRPSVESVFLPQNQPDSHNRNQSPQTPNHPGDVRDIWSSRSTDLSPAEGFRMPPVVMDPQHSEAMEDDHSKFHLQSAGSEARMHFRSSYRPSSQTDSEDNANKSILMKKSYSSRKRQHQHRVERMIEETDGAGLVCSGSQTNFAMMEASGHSQDNMTPLRAPPSHLAFFAPRGVLRPSKDHSSEASMETDTKRRRVEENRRVRFSEEVVTLPSSYLYQNVTDSEEEAEEESFPEEDSVAEQECEVEQPMMEEVAPARRPERSGWIKALIRKNTRRKNKQ
ncbi:uncharacterized protein zgc:113229 isoform X2 [Oryzias melastigma]|uniref:uncharacterized protein zgc:113229 isoform X2 n=1 Tax=Oryzias melastigma TaxID=30732 RepID=UPI000CF7E258|nr:uncharacterized protein zgc:113229 isoform X2 [Oryzias melastigma]